MNDPIADLEQLTEEEIRGFEIYRRKYVSLYPPPLKPNPAKQGWEFRAYLIVSVAAVLLASMRTAEQFYRAATFSANPVLGYIEAFLAVFTVETGIVVYAAVIAARRKKVAQWVMWVGIVLLAAISIVAGLGQSLYLSTDIDPSILKWTEYMLSLLIGPGASIAALIGGHILGQQIATAAQAYEQMEAEYELELEQYNERLIRTWLRSVERKVVLGMVAIPKAALPELEAVVESEAPAAQEVTPAVEKPAPARAAGSPIITPVAVEDGGNHRQAQMQPPNLARTLGPRPASSSAGASGTGATKNSRLVTQWLITNGKTPFDSDINLNQISLETRLDVPAVRETLLRMRSVRPA